MKNRFGSGSYSNPDIDARVSYDTSYAPSYASQAFGGSSSSLGRQDNTFSSANQRKTRRPSARNMSNRFGAHAHNSHGRTVKNSNNSSDLFTRERPRLPSMSSDSLLKANNSFSSRVTLIRNVIEWVDEQEIIFDKLKTPNDLELIDIELKDAFNTINTAFDDLNIILKNQTHSFRQDKAKLLSLKKQFANTEQKLNRKLIQSRKLIVIRQNREKLFAGAKTNGKKMSVHDEMASLNSSHKLIDDALKIVGNVKDELWSQKGLLTSTRNKLLDMTNLVGFSNTLIRIITQRSTVDKWILYGGMFVVLLIIFLIWWFLF